MTLDHLPSVEAIADNSSMNMQTGTKDRAAQTHCWFKNDTSFLKASILASHFHFCKQSESGPPKMFPEATNFF